MTRRIHYGWVVTPAFVGAAILSLVASFLSTRITRPPRSPALVPA